ncbi:MAG: hypothetical protein HY537_14965, partial [Deltaproteobacteria bacterium]|nr:hypothetical protein [Deltaproteobacteria bacterium]
LISERSYNIGAVGSSSSVHYKEPKQEGLAANIGAGFKIRIARQLAFEIEATSYITDVDKPERLINLYGTAGVRLFI